MDEAARDGSLELRVNSVRKEIAKTYAGLEDLPQPEKEMIFLLETVRKSYEKEFSRAGISARYAGNSFNKLLRLACDLASRVENIDQLRGAFKFYLENQKKRM